MSFIKNSIFGTFRDPCQGDRLWTFKEVEFDQYSWIVCWNSELHGSRSDPGSWRALLEHPSLLLQVWLLEPWGHPLRLAVRPATFCEEQIKHGEAKEVSAGWELQHGRTQLGEDLWRGEAACEKFAQGMLFNMMVLVICPTPNILIDKGVHFLSLKLLTLSPKFIFHPHITTLQLRATKRTTLFGRFSCYKKI